MELVWVLAGWKWRKRGFRGSVRRRPRSLAQRPQSLDEGFWVFKKHERDRCIKKSGDRGLSLFLAICCVF